jgi:hypothetical protein
VKHAPDWAGDEDQHTENAATDDERPVGQAACDAGRGGEPDRRRRRKASHGVFADAAQNRTGAEETNARDEAASRRAKTS